MERPSPFASPSPRYARSSTTLPTPVRAARRLLLPAGGLFVLAQLADLVTRLASDRSEANPIAAGMDPLHMIAAKVILVALVLVPAAIFASRRQYRPVGRLLIDLGLAVGLVGAASNVGLL